MPVVSHLIPEIHVHLIAAIPNGLTVEYMPWSQRAVDRRATDRIGQPGRARQAGIGTGVRPRDRAGLMAFDVVECTIATLHAAYRNGDVTARAVTQAYLDRIAAYDRRGPYLNALVTVNARALEVADRLDAELRATGDLSGPLHGIPVIVKDNLDTFDLPTTSGVALFREFVPPRDAFIVERVRAAGGIVLAKASLSELSMGLADCINSVAAWLHPQSVQHGVRERRVERWHRRRGRGELRHGRPGDGHGRQRARAVVDQQPGRDPTDRGTGEPDRDGAARQSARYARTDGAHGRGRGATARRHRRARSGRPAHGSRRTGIGRPRTRPSWIALERVARASACCVRRWQLRIWRRPARGGVVRAGGARPGRRRRGRRRRLPGARARVVSLAAADRGDVEGRLGALFPRMKARVSDSDGGRAARRAGGQTRAPVAPRADRRDCRVHDWRRRTIRRRCRVGKTSSCIATRSSAAMAQAGVEALVFPVWTYPPVLNGDRGQTRSGPLTHHWQRHAVAGRGRADRVRRRGPAHRHADPGQAVERGTADSAWLTRTSRRRGIVEAPSSVPSLV